MSYETLDTIADAYIPVLFFLFVIFSIRSWRAGDRIAAAKGFFGVIACYFIMWLDSMLKLWGMFGMDYSTHTAVASALIVFHLHKRPIYSIVSISFVISFMCYLGLMRYQEYHTFADMLTTIVIIFPLIFATYGLFNMATKKVFHR